MTSPDGGETDREFTATGRRRRFLTACATRLNNARRVLQQFLGGRRHNHIATNNLHPDDHSGDTPTHAQPLQTNPRNTIDPDIFEPGPPPPYPGSDTASGYQSDRSMSPDPSITHDHKTVDNFKKKVPGVYDDTQPREDPPPAYEVAEAQHVANGFRSNVANGLPNACVDSDTPYNTRHQSDRPADHRRSRDRDGSGRE